MYKAVGGPEWSRIVTMLAMFGVAFPLIAAATLVSVVQDSEGRNPIRVARGVVATLRGPLFKGMTPVLLRYVKPGSHPSDIDTEPLLERWRAELLAPRAFSWTISNSSNIEYHHIEFERRAAPSSVIANAANKHSVSSASRSVRDRTSQTGSNATGALSGWWQYRCPERATASRRTVAVRSARMPTTSVRRRCLVRPLCGC